MSLININFNDNYIGINAFGLSDYPLSAGFIFAYKKCVIIKTIIIIELSMNFVYIHLQKSIILHFYSYVKNPGKIGIFQDKNDFFL